MDKASGSEVSLRSKSGKVARWRPSSLMNIMTRSNSYKSNRSVSVLESNGKAGKYIKRAKSLNNDWTTIVTVVLIEAKNLPPAVEVASAQGIYCKLRLGAESLKSKSVPNTEHPKWREQFKLHLQDDNYLHLSVWERGKQKHPLGSCVINLDNLEKERTHVIWQELMESGSIHLSITMCTVRSVTVPENCMCNLNNYKEKYSLTNIDTNLNVIGVLHVKVVGVRGLGSKPSAYCTLRVDNQSVQTHRARTTTEIVWNRCYVFDIHDIISTLDLKVYESSLANTFLNESLGKVSIPLLKIVNEEMRWYALKVKNRAGSTRGNCPRVLLQMSIMWNPVKATLKLFQPREETHLKKGIKFDVGLIYSNILFISNVFDFLVDINDGYKRLFEWDDQEFSFCVLIGWIVFCYFIQVWMVPLLLLIPFGYYWLWKRHEDNVGAARQYSEEEVVDINNNSNKNDDKSLMGRLKIQELQQVTITVTRGIEMIASYAERFANLVSFKVPFLSYVTMIILVVVSIGLYIIPFNYILMGFGIMKFTRKYKNPNRLLNNDLLDFVSRLPDDDVLKEWKELHVPKPNREGDASHIMARSFSTSS
ncbi:multiple C2 and transmembrane domain-containing protein-like isoform X1 [Leptidea sinapis]|uniref:multiple C2 and transmembrane domain-containing protein-like isoform X1 n=2 Tax=Leptidea sinapis TaxID=189913 RepID=UPI0021C4849A|nr:multiple C2 and transmembrane domain-containing protein-like isoform X1 [Leptidea sinapis]